MQAAQIPSHAGIFNPNFAISDPQSATYGWEASGAVTIVNGQAVLSEDSNVISTLSQTFTLPAGSTHLRFTLADVNLNSNGINRPQDAFEVAFLESSTLTPFVGVTAGLMQTDSLFNLQQDGTVRFSNRVTLSNGVTSGSLLDLTQPVIVDIDLTGLASGVGGRLSFDLLGFGDRTSTVVLDNVLLIDGQPTAAPVAVNDSYTVAEGATFNVPTLGLLTNDTDADTASSGLSALLVTGPQHGTLSLNVDGSFSYIHNGSETLTDAFTYRVSDGINFSNVATVSFTITPTNDAPSIAAISAQSVEQGRTLTVTITATDPDDSNIAPESNTLTYSLGAGAPVGASIDPSTGVFTWAVPRTQAVWFYQITVNVTDAGTPAFSATRTFTVEVKELTNTPPTLNPIGNKTVNEETELRFTISATDLDLPAQTIIYSATGLPTGATFNASTREFVWTPAEDQGGASYQMTFSVTDGEFSASEVVTITVNEGNVAPVLAAIGAKTVNEQTELRFTINATDHDIPTQTLIYSATGLPAGATFDAITREFVWTPTEAQGPGSYNVTFSVTDGVVTTSETITITVNEVNVAPVLNGIGNKTINEQTELRFTISGSDVDDPAQLLVYSATGVPSGATFNPATREFVWTPTEAQGPGSYNVTFSVTDGVVTTSETIAITVNEVNVAPVLAPIGPKTVAEGSLLSFTISATDADLPAQTLVYSATGLPTGATFNAVTRTFSWTPTEAQGPSAPVVTFSVSDGVTTTSEAVTITVTEVNQAPVLQAITNKTVNEGSLLTFTASATDADLSAQTLTYSLAASAPAGATIHATTGVFAWTSADGPGTSPYSVTIQVSDGIATASQTFTITVNNVAPTATLTLPSPAVAGVDLTFSGMINDAGSADTLQAAWTFGDGTSTPFQAASRGTVTTTKQYATAGTYTVTLTVKDNNGEQTNVSGSLTVATNGLVTDPWDATKTALVINGTNVGDNITVSPSGTTNFQVTINGQSQIFTKPTGRIIVHGWGGGDNISITSTITTPTLLFGDAGGDNLTGGAGPNVILGGVDSGDNLIGGAARDVLIGGSGGDNLTGNGEDDLLIAGTTIYETNLVGLCSIVNEWLRTDKTYSQRVTNLVNGGGLNGTTKLNATTVFDDTVGDNLTGNAGTDWFFAKVTAPGPDNVISVAGETITAPGAPPAPLLAQGGVVAEDGSLAVLTDAQLAPIVEAARAQWLASGLTADQAAALSALQFTIADLDGATIGLTVGTSVLIDRTAAGREWFIDPTPQDHAEFHFVRGLSQWIADAHSPASGRMDLLTTVLHEMGHALGFGDQAAHQRHANLMTETLPTGVRRTLLPDLPPAGLIALRTVQEPLTSGDGWIERLLGRSLSHFTGAWRSNTSGSAVGLTHGSDSTTNPAPALIDWTGDEQADTQRKKPASAVGAKTAWLSRFLLQTGRQDVQPHEHDINIVLPGKK